MNLSNNSFVNNPVRLAFEGNGVYIGVLFNEFSGVAVMDFPNAVLAIVPIGLQRDGSTVQVERNSFERNTISGDLIDEATPTFVIVWEGNEASYFNNNDFISNTTEYLFKSKDLLSTDVNAKGNWWGTDDEDALKSQIYDCFQNGEYSIVDYSNWQTEPIAPKAGKVGVAANEVRPK